MERSYKALACEIYTSCSPVFVECWASWCLPCKQYDSTLKELAAQYENRCGIYKINVDRNPQVSKEYCVHGLPTFMTFFQRKELDRKIGAQPSYILRKMIDEALVCFDEYREIKEKEEIEEQSIVEQRLKELGYI